MLASLELVGQRQAVAEQTARAERQQTQLDAARRAEEQREEENRQLTAQVARGAPGLALTASEFLIRK